MRVRTILTIAIIVFGVTQASWAGAGDNRPFLHPLFTDNMVLQRDLADPIWGWTTPECRVTVSLNGKTASARADASGKWMTRIGPFKAGGPYTLTVSGPRTVSLDNVMIGDVWLCSGQSNMEMGIAGAKDSNTEIQTANFPGIRLYTVPKAASLEPQETVNGSWQACTPATVAKGGWGGFSAVSYFYGRELHQRTGVPIGLIHASWGGTIAEAWASAAALKPLPDFTAAVTQVEQGATWQRQLASGRGEKVTEWWAKNDPGSATLPGWQDPAAASATDWKPVALPQPLEKSAVGVFDGVVWFRREVDLPAAWVARAAVLHLGPIDDYDTTWINGVRVGTSEDRQWAREYEIPAGVLKAGRNVIAVRVLDTGGEGGLTGTATQLNLQQAGQTIALAGNWQIRASSPLSTIAPYPAPYVPDNQNITTLIYNGMIAPLVPFGIKGAIWYQGESNASRARQYRTLLPTLIKDWRTQFGGGDFPFYIVQLANYMAVDTQPTDPDWAHLREAQLLTSQAVPHSGLAVAIDIGDTADIHPTNKQEVGRRLALNALAKDYGQKIEYSGPTYRSLKITGNEIQLTFDHAGGMAAKDGPKLLGFAICGENKKWVWANARINDKTIVVSAAEVPAPIAVRYAWSNNPVANLYNGAGLPASPFRTDFD